MRRIVYRILAVVGASLLAIGAVAVVLLAALDAGYFHAALLHRAQTWLGRSLEADDLKVHLLTSHPSIEARRVKIGNPAWTAPGTLAQIGSVEMRFRWPQVWPGRAVAWSIESLRLEHALLTLSRDEDDHANWRLRDPTAAAGRGLPLIRSLALRDSRMQLHDQRRHLDFDGPMSIEATEAGRGLELNATGSLNAHDAKLHVSGDALSTVSLATPYRFKFVEDSSGSHLQGDGEVTRPFDFREMTVTFRATGNNLLDFYNLTGLKLLATGPYALRGKMARRDLHTDFTELEVNSGDSDLRGQVMVDLTRPRRRIQAVLHSGLLRVADLRTRAAADGHLFSDRPLNATALARADAQITYGADQLEAGPLALRNVSVMATIEQGIFSMRPVRAELRGGTVLASLKIDAASKPATAALDLQFKDVRSGQAIDGPLHGHLALTGPGASLRQFASAANGSIRIFLGGGVVRAALAEISSVDLRGVGLLLSKSDREVSVRCGAAIFNARNGVLSTERLLLDTQPVLISGSGVIHLDTENVDLRIEGNPKQTRVLRLRTPLLVTGPLRHPAVTLEKQNAKLKLIDRGTAIDADCAMLDR